jgi:hypothetical protein
MGYQLIHASANEIRQPSGLFANVNFSNRFTDHPYADFLLGLAHGAASGARLASQHYSQGVGSNPVPLDCDDVTWTTECR